MDNNLTNPIFQDYIATASSQVLPLIKKTSDFRDSLGPLKSGLKNSFKNGLYSTVIVPQAKLKQRQKLNRSLRLQRLRSLKRASLLLALWFIKLDLPMKRAVSIPGFCLWIYTIPIAM